MDCPYGFNFGEDFGRYNECDHCQNAEKCEDVYCDLVDVK